MSRDQNYLALTQIERGMENELSTFSSSDSRLETYLRTMEHAPSLQINGVLKVFSMIAARDEQIGRYESADAAYTWMNALCRAKDSTLYKHMFPSIEYEEEIVPQFLKEAHWSHELEHQESKDAWQMVTLTTLACGALLALGVLVFHFPFVISLLLVLALYFYLVFSYCFWWRQRNVLLLLEALREKMSPTLQHFAHSIVLVDHPFYPSYEDRTALRQTLRLQKSKSLGQKEPERNIHGLTKAEAKAKRKGKAVTSTSSSVIQSPKASLKEPVTQPVSSRPRLSIFMEEEAKEKERQAQKANESVKESAQAVQPKAKPTKTASKTKSKKGLRSRGLGSRYFSSAQKIKSRPKTSPLFTQSSHPSSSKQATLH